MAKPVILSGIQPSGNLHIGNYLGAIKNWVDLQNNSDYDCYYCIVDLHSLSGAMHGAQLQNQTRTMAAELIAAGINPDKATFFVQSHVPEHTELAWIFNCVTPVAELYRMTQYKDKSAHQEKNINAGLLTYPILQAADILLYRPFGVPVGKDQEQHLELTNDIARWFNNKFLPTGQAGGETFKPVKCLSTEIPKVMSLLEPTKKMSKSAGDAHVINLSDEPEIIEKKLKKAVTATEGGDAAPGVQNLLLLLKQFGSKAEHAQFVAAEKDGAIRYGDLKQALAAAIGTHFADFRAKRANLLENPKELDALLEKGAVKARAAAQKTMADVRTAVGIR